MRPDAPQTSAQVASPRPLGPRYLVWEYLMRLWRRFLFSSLGEAIGSPLLYLLAMGVGLGSLVDRNGNGGALGGVSYLQYIAPALLCAAALQIAVGESSYPAYSRFHWGKEYWAITATPITPLQVADGQLLFVATRLVTGAAAYFVVVLAFGAGGGWTGLLMIPIAVLMGAGFGSWVLVLGARMRSEGGAFNMVFRFVVLPMTLFSGSFFPVEQIPWAVRWLTLFSPLWHANELARGAVLGGLEVGAAAGHLGFLVLLLAAGIWAMRRSYTSRLIV